MNELNAFAFEKPVNPKGMVGVDTVDDAEDVELNTVLLQQLEGSVNFVKSRFATFVNTVSIVQLFQSVHAQPDQKIMLFKKSAPFVIQQDAVGLKGVFDFHAGFAILLLQLHSLAKEVKPHQSRFAALPAESDFIDLLRLNVLAGECLKDIIGHVKTRALFVKVLLAEVEAVSAVKVANRTARLKHDMEGRG
ncbi:hypothetical protein HRbin17_00489 [bacterium HR17]|uniref:Uncharacterized protein n=1 Tax=Candidatus Fervidibacter japonicus TaxID=2035412 RepID=A0A2H5XA00_9BACT|nr:hypothetical protein HRbin17_00489 [bacterium HR17]